MKKDGTIPVVILCGGKGTRLGDITKLKPKPLVAVGGMPILWHIMKTYAHHGYKDFVLCLGYKGDAIVEFFEKGAIPGSGKCPAEPKEPDWKITFADTGAETGTGGRVFKIRWFVERFDRFFLTYGDGLSSVPIDRLLDFHRHKGTIGTVTAVRPATTFGIIQENDGIATGFVEKPQLDVLINGGFFVMERRFFDYLEEDGALEDRPLRKLAERRELAVYRHEGFWQCMDDQKQVEMLNAMWERGERPWADWERSGEKRDER